MSTHEETSKTPLKFDFSAFPADSLFHERRTGRERRDERPAAKPPAPVAPTGERRQRKERRRRVDPTTFEKQYTEDEIEFMNAMQRFKIRTGRQFPSHGEVLSVAAELGYRKVSPSVPIGELKNLAADEPEHPVADVADPSADSPILPIECTLPR